MPKDALALVVDLGGTCLRTALADARGRLQVVRPSIMHTGEGHQRTLQHLLDELDATLNEGGRHRVTGIGVGVASPVDPVTGVMYNPPNLPGWDQFSLRPLLETRFGLPVFIGNDANLACLAEHRFGVGRGTNHLVYLTIGTGIGAGILVDGKLLAGRRGFAGEIGHMSIDRNGPLCNCGNVGCLEAMASGTAIGRMAQERLQAGESSCLWELVQGDLERVTGELVTQEAARGDELARRVLQETATSLGLGIVNILHIFDPEMVILGGGVAHNLHLFYPTIVRTVQGHVMAHRRNGVPVVASVLGGEVGLLGAAALALGDDTSP